MGTPHPELLRSRDLRTALSALGDLAEASADEAAFAACGVQLLSRLVASDLTTLSRCDLRSGRRQVVGMPAGAIGGDARAAFDRHFHEHPLVLYHGAERGAFAHRISDSLSPAAFRETALYNDYYRRIGLDHALAVPVWRDNGELVSFVFNRSGHDFADRELALLDALRRPLSQLFGRLRQPPPPVPLTPREDEVLRWVAMGKTDSDVAALIGCSPRTVHKHLQRVYTKLGVETRTAAVMRRLGRS